MPDENSRESPAGNSQPQSLPPTPIPSPIQERVVSEDRRGESNSDKNGTKELAREVHWLQHATFWSQICLGIIGTIALWIYGNQLKQMRVANGTTQQAVTVASNTLAETQRANAQQRLDNATAAELAKMRDNEGIVQASKALQATIDNSHSADRAWIGIATAKPTSYSTQPDQSVGMTVEFTLRNYGLSAGEHVKLLAHLESDPMVFSSSCADVSAKNFMGGVLFPTQEHKINWYMNLTKAQMEQGWTHQNPQLGRELVLKVIGCIVYSDRNGEKPPHSTPFTYLVWWNKGYIMPNSIVPIDELSLQLYDVDTNQTK